MKISFFFPVYNDERTVEILAGKAEDALRKHCEDYEVIIVVDASPDKSGEIADDLAEKNKKIRVVHHPGNKGYAQAILTGIRESRFGWIFFTDGDMQFDPKELGELLKYTHEADIILGYRIKRADPWQRALFSFFYNKMANLLFGLNVYDVNCAFKLIKKDVLESMTIGFNHKEAFFFVEVFYKIKKMGYKMKQVPVHHYPRLYGRSQCFSAGMIVRYIFCILTAFVQCRIYKDWET